MATLENYGKEKMLAAMTLQELESHAYHEYEDVERFCRVGDLKEIEKNDFNLNIACYVQITEPEPKVVTWRRS